jgi:HSP20 family molecular chaperone IbpA
MDVKETDKEIIIEAELPGIEEGHFAHPPERVF